MTKSLTKEDAKTLVLHIPFSKIEVRRDCN